MKHLTKLDRAVEQAVNNASESELRETYEDAMYQFFGKMSEADLDRWLEDVE